MEKQSLTSNPWTVFLFEAGFFALALALGILTSLMLKELLNVYHVYSEPISIKNFLIWFFIGTAFIVWIIYFVKSNKGKRIFFKTLFLLAVVLGSLLFFNLWLPDLLSVFIVGLAVWFWLKKPLVILHNLLLVFAIAAVSARIGLSLRPETIIVLLLMFSVYDYIAVYKTKHMVKMAQEMISQQAIIGLVIPQRLIDFKADLKQVKQDGRFMILGAGDIVFPLILAVSVISQSIVYSLIIALFSLLGLLVSFLIFNKQKVRKPMPALPAIAIMSIIGYLITILL